MPSGRTVGSKENKDATKVVKGKKIGTGKLQAVVPPEEVIKLAELHCTDTEIANYFGVNIDTLRNNFKQEMEQGRERTKQRIRASQISMATDTDNPNATMLIWLGKQMLNQRDNKDINLTGQVLSAQEIEQRLNKMVEDVKQDNDIIDIDTQGET